MNFLSRLLLTFFLLILSAGASAGNAPPRIGLALGSGGAGGLAHIAMLEVFEEQEITPERIAGSSIGAIIGALYAAGMDSAEIRSLFIDFGNSALNPFSALDGDAVVSWTDLLEFDFTNGSVVSADGFLQLVASRMEARDFDDLEIPLTIVATDYWSGETVVLTEGDLFRAIKASMAVPGLFAPVVDGERLLIDGGVSNPLPWDLLIDQDVIVAIDVTGVRSPSPNGPPGLTDLLFKTFEITQQAIIRQKLASDPPDFYIKPEISNIRLLHFDRVDEIVEQADVAARQLRKALQTARSP